MDINKVSATAVSLVLIFWSSVSNLTESENNGYLKVEDLVVAVSLDRSQSDLGMMIQLTSKSKGPLRIYESDLPWAHWNSLVLTAVKPKRGGEVLKNPRALPIDDPGPRTLVLAPGTTVQGRISLDKRFPDISQEIQRSDILIFWSYQLTPIDAAQLERAGGWFLIPKSG